VKVSVNQGRVRMSANLIQSTHFSGSYVENQQGTVIKKKKACMMKKCKWNDK